jgi:hypothetical protein
MPLDLTLISETGRWIVLLVIAEDFFSYDNLISEED